MKYPFPAIEKSLIKFHIEFYTKPDKAKISQMPGSVRANKEDGENLIVTWDNCEFKLCTFPVKAGSVSNAAFLRVCKPLLSSTYKFS